MIGELVKERLLLNDMKGKTDRGKMKQNEGKP